MLRPDESRDTKQPVAMHIDRQRFLVLASAMAAGCGGGEAVPAEIPVATPLELEAGVESEPAAEVPAEPEMPLPSGDSSGVLRASLSKRCDGLREPSGPFCEGFEETVSLCTQYADMMRPSAAREAVSCLTGRSGTSGICGYEAGENCFLAGLTTGVATSEAARFCRDVMSNCSSSRWRSPELNETSCQRAVGAVQKDRVDDLVACMNEGCGIKRCVFDLMN